MFPLKGLWFGTCHYPSFPEAYPFSCLTLFFPFFALRRTSPYLVVRLFSDTKRIDSFLSFLFSHDVIFPPHFFTQDGPFLFRPWLPGPPRNCLLLSFFSRSSLIPHPFFDTVVLPFLWISPHSFSFSGRSRVYSSRTLSRSPSYLDARREVCSGPSFANMS